MPVSVQHLLTCPSPNSEVRQSLNNAQSQYSQWSMLLDSEADIDKVQSAASELKNCVKSIEWDLEDLEQTISILITCVLVYVCGVISEVMCGLVQELLPYIGTSTSLFTIYSTVYRRRYRR